MSAAQSDLVVEDVFAYWQAETGTKLRAQKTIDAAKSRIRRRLAEGYTPADLKRCVDFARYDEFYNLNGYYRQPDVIWRNAERVQSILQRVQRISERPLPL